MKYEQILSKNNFKPYTFAQKAYVTLIPEEGFVMPFYYEDKY